MSAAFRRKGRTIRSIKLPTRAGIWVTRTTGTRDPVRARRMQAMVAALGPQGKCAWELLETVTATPAKWTLSQLYDHWIAAPITRHHMTTGKAIEPSIDERVEHVRAQLVEQDIRRLVTKWHGILGGPSERIHQATADHYRGSVRLFLAHVAGEDWETADATIPLARLSERELRVWIEEMDDVEPGTVRKRGMGMRRFTQWLKGRGILPIDPMREVALPPAGKPRVHYLETREARALADAQPAPYRQLAALLAGTGIEVSVALALRRRDVDEPAREIRAAGTKTYNRDRVVRVAEWAWSYIAELLEGRLPDATLFEAIPHRWAAGDVHRGAVEALCGRMPILLEHGGYTMRDHRHTYAVRAIRAGTPAELVARQLGHVDAVLVHRVYGRFAPTQREREHWEQIAAARDVAAATAAQRRAHGTKK